MYTYAACTHDDETDAVRWSLSAAVVMHVPLQSVDDCEGALFGNNYYICLQSRSSLLSLCCSLSALHSVSLLGRSVSPEVEISMQGNPPSTSRPRVSTSYSAVRGSHEHYERIECTYIGSCEVSHGMGMEILNEAVDKLSNMTHRWLNVNVDVATSSIKISDTIVSNRHCDIKTLTSYMFSYN